MTDKEYEAYLDEMWQARQEEHERAEREAYEQEMYEQYCLDQIDAMTPHERRMNGIDKHTYDCRSCVGIIDLKGGHTHNHLMNAFKRLYKSKDDRKYLTKHYALLYRTWQRWMREHPRNPR